MGKAAAFVCVIALGIILIASGDTGEEFHLIKREKHGLSTNNTTESTFTEESLSRKTAAQNGNKSGDKLMENSTSYVVKRSLRAKENNERLKKSEDSVCASPPDIPGAITPELEGTQHPLGTSVTYSCPLGFVSRNSINHISVCRKNATTSRAEWTVPEITCNPRSCGDPGYVNNGRRIGNLFTFSNKVEYECEEGYKLRGLNSRYCQAGGEWSGRLPTCDQIYCSVPTDPANGRVTYSSLEYGTELKYECNAGFLLDKHHPRICSENGSWSNEEPECIEATCEEPQPPKHGTVQLHGDLKVGTLATYSCNPGRILYGATTTKCLISGKWTFDAPECLNSCKVPFIENGDMGRYEIEYTRWNVRREIFKKVLPGDDVNPGDTLSLLCRSGSLPVQNSEFVESNPLKVTCSGGTWSTDLQCKETKCYGSPPEMNNGKAVVGNRAHGYTIHYKCDGNPIKKILGNVTCHFGSWIGVTPKCLYYPCYTSNLNYPGLVKPPEEHFDTSESFEVKCEAGYRKAPRIQKITCDRGKWDISKKPCINERDEDGIISSTEESKVSPGECFCTYDYENSRVQAQTRNKMLRRGDTLKLGEVVYMSCTPGYEFLKWKNGFRFSGRVQMTCRICKKWQKEDLPTCQRVTSDYTVISYEQGDLEVLPGGIIDVPMGRSRRFQCRSSWDPPIWDFGGRLNLEVNSYKLSDRGTSSYVSYLDVVQAVDMHSGKYECFMRGAYGVHEGSTFMHLKVNDEEYRATSVIEPRVTPSSLLITPNTNVESSSHPTSDIRGYEDCFCSYDYEDPLVNAYIGRRILQFRDRIRRGEVVSFECKYPGKVLTWQNGLRLYGKANVTCNTCKAWERRDVPICKDLERNDVVISNNSNILPGGIINVQKQERQRFSCTNNWRQPDWDYGQRRGVSVNKTQIPGIESVHYISYLDIDNDADDISGEYECYVYDDFGQRSGSTSLHLQVNESGICCPPIDKSNIFSLKYSNGRRINSTVTFFCKDHGKRIEGLNDLICLSNRTWSGSIPKCVDYVSCPKFADSSELLVNYSKGGSVGSVATFNCSATTSYLIGSDYSVCQENGNWSNPLPSCEDHPKCSIHILSISIPEGIEPDISNVTGEYVMFGTKVKLICTDKSVMDGDPHAQCGEKGVWKLGEFKCVQGCILNLDPSSHLLVQPKKDSYYKVGESVLLSCPEGKKMSEKVERIMCLPSRWSDSFPECKEPGEKDER